MRGSLLSLSGASEQRFTTPQDRSWCLEGELWSREAVAKVFQAEKHEWMPGKGSVDIVTGSGQNKCRGVLRGKPRARIDVSMPVLGIGGGKDVVVEAIALHLPFGQVSRVTDGSLGDALDARIKERIRFPIKHQGMRGSWIDQSEQIPGDETRRI